jgi:flagellar capping protein FliD
MGISINGPSGIDTAYIIDSLITLEHDSKIKPMESRKSAYQLQIDAYTKLQSFITDIGSKAFALNSLNSFNIYKQTSSNDMLATLTGGVGANEGSYSLQVFQLARQEKMISKDGLITSQTATLSSLGISTGTITIDGVGIEIGATDTINDLRTKINTATKSDGTKIAVTASVLKISDTDFRLTLTAKNTGAEGISYQGQGLVDLGILAVADGQKGNVAQALTSADDVNAAFAALASGQVIEYAGTDRSGYAVANTFVKTATSTIGDFLKQINDTYHGMVDVSVDGTGKLVLTDKQGGTSRLAMTSLKLGGIDHAMSITTVGDEGAGVLMTGQNAYFSVDGVFSNSKTDAAEGFITGVTINLKKANPAETVQLSLNRDLDAVTDKVQKLIDAFNALVKFGKQATAYADPDDKNAKKGDLAGDMTVNNIITQFRAEFQRQFNLLGGSYRNLLSLGIKTDAQTGELTMDQDAFKKALEMNFDDVTQLFTAKTVSDNNAVSFGRSSDKTAAGTYTLKESDDHQRILAQLAGTSEWIESDVREGDIVSFSSGALEGLMLTAPAGSIPAGTTSTFTFSKGLTDYLKQLTDNMNDSTSGLIYLHQQSLRKSIDYAASRIDTLQAQIDRYRERLTKQFSDMEQQLQTLKSQSSKMLSTLGYSTSSS